MNFSLRKGGLLNIVWTTAERSRLGFATLDKAGVQTHIPNMVPVQNPGQEPFQAQSITTMRTGSVFTL